LPLSSGGKTDIVVPPEPRRTFVAGYDGTAPAERALVRALELAEALGARVVVVSVAPPLVPVAVGPQGAFGLAPYGPYPDTAELGTLVEQEEELWHEHRRRVEELFEAHGVDAELQRATGDAADELVAAAEERGAELIVVGTREAGFVERLLGGSVSQDVARRARCDVLVVHPHGAERRGSV
jgi:nucleotide-binding universal stress UspA family protein